MDGRDSRQTEDIQNEQVKEDTYRKSPWRFAFLVLAVYGAAELLGSLIARILYLGLSDPALVMGEAASVGIIGGADGPTAIFVTTSGWTSYMVPMLLLAVGIWGFLRLRKCKQK